ncbi:MAG: SRPBCC family protein [Actinomycetota bacterium]|nr:SRPBCC family protein [Actinomycetota bacterium]
MARQRVLGLPIGKQKRSRANMAKAVGAGAAMLAVPAIAVPAARKASGVAKRAGDTINKGKDVAGKVSSAMDTASDVQQAVSSHSSTIGKVSGAIKAVKGGGSGGGTKPKLSHLIEQHTDIAVPRSVVYNQWTQLKMFATITKGIESVEQESDENSKWTSKIGPSRRTWNGHVVEQIPDERIAWKSEGGAQLQGVVTFHSLDTDLTRVLLQMEYKPKGAFEWVGNTLRIQRRRAKRDLRLFKHFIELRGEETGAWREQIDEDDKLEPLFAGQGKVRSKQSSDRGSHDTASGEGASTGDSGSSDERRSRRGASGTTRSRTRSSESRGSSGSGSTTRGSGSRQSKPRSTTGSASGGGRSSNGRNGGRSAHSSGSSNGQGGRQRTGAASGSRSSGARRRSETGDQPTSTPRRSPARSRS